ncbi:hypothetical protein V6N12_005555 [Hibiscus sabdariffa]|uniref:Uncharacterized protein n=1 Tax=Hibiscus sabdariffa TaxID=183260 RepID=A0ABR2A9V3_9ROSI
MRRNESRTKSVRKPLRDLTNNETKRSFSKSEIPTKKMIPKDSHNNQNDSSIDRLLLLHSDLSSFLRQIDELVVQAFKLKATEQGRKEIESFMNAISDMLSSLKPWIPRFQKALSSPAEEHKDQPGKHLEAEIVPFVDANEKECLDVGSPEETTMDSLISPSPLVSWRAAGGNVERGRQLFLLTPLPMSKAMSSKRRDSSKSVYEGIASTSNVELASFLNIPRDENDDLLEGVIIKATPVKPSGSIVVETDNTSKHRFVSSPVFSERDHSVLVMTPCLKMSPPKSCVLLEPVHESLDRSKFVVCKSTPYPVGTNNSGFSESIASEEASEDLSLKYPELRGIQRTRIPEMRKNELEASPTWLFSPPKSCILLEPPDEKFLDHVGTEHHLPITGALNQQTDACREIKTTSQGNSAPVETTPMWKEGQSTMQRGKHPGESTLKKELWTKFEAVSTYGLHYNTSAGRRTARKGFLDMLDEVSCDEES